jgi:protein tyrosine phosphatase (PTP) superfamily phosphohydrolase (DUF442 family)
LDVHSFTQTASDASPASITNKVAPQIDVAGHRFSTFYHDMNRKVLPTLSLLGCLLLSGCAIRPTTMPTHHWPQPNHTRIAGVSNFGEVTPTIWRGSQPTAEGFRNLERAGVKTIINLRSSHDDLPALRDTKLQYLRIPMRAWDPDQGQFAQLTVVMQTLERLLQSPSAGPIFIHCAQGRDRTGYVVATYRRLFQQWSADDSLEEMFDYGFNRLWFRNPGHIRKLDLKLMQELLQRAP